VATELLSPTPVQRFYDNNNNPLVGGKLFTYSAGTSTKLTSYKDSTGTTNTNPIILNARGECNLWIPPNVAYKYVLAPATDSDPPTNPFWTVDQASSAQLVTLYGGTDTGSVNAYILNFTSNFSSYTDGILIYWTPANTNTGASTINVNGIGVVAIVNTDGTPVRGGQIVANQPTSILYRTGSFMLIGNVVISGSFTATLNGFTTATTGTVYYNISNGVCTLSTRGGAIAGTSNTTAMNMTGIPSQCVPIFDQITLCGGILDNGVVKIGSVLCDNSGTFTFSLLNTATVANRVIADAAAFTAAGTKGIANTGWQISYPLN
jgi:hypothetical protein